MLSGTVPRLVEPDYSASVLIAGSGHRLLFYGPTDVRFEHQCDRGARGVIICAPRLTNVEQPGGHQISAGPTVSPSILCDDCGTHGWIRDGTWVPA